MRSPIFAAGCLVLGFLGACSSADTLPSGGPYGGAAFDATADAPPAPFVPDGDAGSTTNATTGATTVASSGPTTVATSGTVASTATSASSTGAAPTWTYLFTTYLATPGTIGSCDGMSCHYHTECDNKDDCYAFIGTAQDQSDYGALSGTGYTLFSWNGGSMPQGGPVSEPQASADFAAWQAAGGLNN